VQALDRLLSAWDVASPQALGAVESCLAEVEDLLSYCNDVLATGGWGGGGGGSGGGCITPKQGYALWAATGLVMLGPAACVPGWTFVATHAQALARPASPAGVEGLRTLLLDCLWQAFVGPVLFWPLIQDDVAVQHIAALTLTGDSVGQQGLPAVPAAFAGGGAGRVLPARDVGALRTVQRGSVGPLCSLYVFERLFRAVTDQHVLAVLVSALLGGGAAAGSRSGSPAGSRPGSPDEQRAAAKWQLPLAVLARLQYSPAVYRQTVLGMLRDQDAQVAAAAVRVLAALLQSRAASEEQLEFIGAPGSLHSAGSART
jgi:hypothetical protein